MELTKLSEIATELGVSTQTVRNYYHELPDNEKQKIGKSFAVSEKSKIAIFQQIQSQPQNQNKTFAKVLRSDSNEVLAYFERVIREKDAIILEQQRHIGLLTAKVEQLQLSEPKKKGWWMFWR